jgi:maltose alpha-D-glucosyltransferase/alpha-amylase
LYEREGTSCENLAETHAYLKSLRKHVDEKYADRMLLAEANQWPEDAVNYFGSGKGDECHMAFHFPLMPRMFMAVRMEDRIPIVDILEQTPAIPETSQWALFLRNHDELTLEMVTDEERDYMYRVYADDARARINLGIRRRLAPLLGNDRRRIELLYVLLFSLPGTPVLYYGDEIGMGDNIFLGDRNGVRTPMQWSSDKNAGFSRASPQALYLPITLDPEYHYEAVNVEAQLRNPNSLFWWMKRTLALRKRYRAFGRGTLQFLHPENRKILVFVRRFQDEVILVVANLSRFPQPVAIDLSEFQQMCPVELFGRATFPAITATPYSLTLSPHAAFWFSLEPAVADVLPAQTGAPEMLTLAENWEDLFRIESRPKLENALCGFVKKQPWFRGVPRQIKTVQIRDVINLSTDSGRSFLLLLLVEFLEGDPEDYLLPVGVSETEASEQPDKAGSPDIIVRLRVELTNQQGFLYAGAHNTGFCKALMEFVRRRRLSTGQEGELQAFAGGILRNGASEGIASLEPVFRQPGINNTAAVFGDRLFLKLFARLERGTNPELEFGRFLTERHFPNVPPVAGYLEYRRHNGERFDLAIVTRFLPNAQDAWGYTLDMLGRYFDRMRSAPVEKRLESPSNWSLLQLAAGDVPESIVALIGTYLELARRLGQRTGEMHLALSADPQDRDFAPEPFTPFYQRALYQSMRNLATENLQLVRHKLGALPETIRADAKKLISLENEILKRFRAVSETRLQAQRIRCHGDFHLGQVLYTGKDFMFLDFQAETSRSFSERRIRRSPLRDVAGMIRSFDYVTNAALWKQLELGVTREDQLAQLQPWADFWCRWVSAVFLKAYLKVVGDSPLIPRANDHLNLLLEVHLLEKEFSELGFELRNRLDWVKIPLRSILRPLELPL